MPAGGFWITLDLSRDTQHARPMNFMSVSGIDKRADRVLFFTEDCEDSTETNELSAIYTAMKFAILVGFYRPSTSKTPRFRVFHWEAERVYRVGEEGRLEEYTFWSGPSATTCMYCGEEGHIQANCHRL